MENRERETSQQSVEFETDTFTIKFLSHESNGLKVSTNQSLLRHAPNTPLPFAERIAQERAKEKKRFRVGKDFAPKVGVRNPRMEGNELIVDVMPVTFPTFKAIGEPNLTEQEMYISNPSATSLILRTTEPDGSSKFIIQERSPKNFFYGGVPGASVAGYLDADLITTGEMRARINPIDTNFVTSNGVREMREEIGLYPRDIEGVKITGFASDKVRVHDEFLLSAKTKLSAQDFLFRSGMGYSHRFIEQSIIIDANQETINKLLTEVKCPLPPTHLAAFIAAEYSLILEEQGIDAADEWKRHMQDRVNQNYRQIDEMVRRFYIDNPEEINNVVEGKPPRKTTGYDPAYLPEQQGLPSLDSELERVGIKSKELGTVVDDVYVFDVDGVLTDPNEKLFDREVMENIAKRLNEGKPVILNTGRSVSWVQSNIVARLHFAYNVVDKKAWQNLFIIGEKGGTWLGFDENGLMPPMPSRDESIAMPEEILKLVKDVSKEYKNTMMYDTTKWTMASIEQLNGFTEREHEEMFVPAQKELAERLKEFIQEIGLDHEFRVDATQIAIDVENKLVGKDFAMQRAIAWLRQRRIFPKKYITFGDSTSDFAMARQLHEDGMNVEHVHVGSSPVPEGLGFNIIETRSKFNKGTSEYFKSLKEDSS
jgi:hydroxymethylpyrimidine pyrophosphatase-like HAD family hydrolase